MAEISETEAYARYEDMLDEVHGDVELGDLVYSPSAVLKAVDPIAYRCGFTDFVDSLEEDEITVEGF